jgi:hypothetical protein
MCRTTQKCSWRIRNHIRWLVKQTSSPCSPSTAHILLYQYTLSSLYFLRLLALFSWHNKLVISQNNRPKFVMCLINRRHSKINKWEVFREFTCFGKKKNDSNNHKKKIITEFDETINYYNTLYIFFIVTIIIRIEICRNQICVHIQHIIFVWF